MEEELEIKWKVLAIIFIVILSYLSGYYYHKFTNTDSKLVQQYKANFAKCSLECDTTGYITQIDDTHYKCVCSEN